MADEFRRLAAGQFSDPRALPEFQRRLHRAQQAAIRAQRERHLRAVDRDPDGRRWPGLVDVQPPAE